MSAASAFCPRPSALDHARGNRDDVLHRAANLDARSRRRCHRGGRTDRGTRAAPATPPRRPSRPRARRSAGPARPRRRSSAPTRHDDRVAGPDLLSRSTSDTRSSEPSSMPLVALTMTASGGEQRRRRLHHARACRAREWRTRRALRPAAPRRARPWARPAPAAPGRAGRQGSHGAPAGRRRARDRAPTAGRRARAGPRWMASAVPQLPAPETATVFMRVPESREW